MTTTVTDITQGLMHVEESLQYIEEAEFYLWQMLHKYEVDHAGDKELIRLLKADHLPQVMSILNRLDTLADRFRIMRSDIEYPNHGVLREKLLGWLDLGELK